MAVAIRPLVMAATAAWDAFVEAHPDGTFFHRAAWSTIIEQAFGHRSLYAYAERDGAITGVLPLAQVKTLLFGNTLISVPFCVYGGPLAVDRETSAALSAHAASLLERTGAGAVEFRYRGRDGGMPAGGMSYGSASGGDDHRTPSVTPSPDPPIRPPRTSSPAVNKTSGQATEESPWPATAPGTVPPGSSQAMTWNQDAEPARDSALHVAADRSVHSPGGINDDCAAGCWLTRPDLYVTFRKRIEADHDKNLKSIPRKQRAMVRKGIQNGLRSVVHRDVRQLHGIYAESVRNLGTPVFSRRYFAMLTEVFGPDCDILTVLDGDNPIAAVMNFYFRDEVLPYYGGGTAFARQRAANDFMYWEVMRRAADRDCRLFDFGRSKLGTGAFEFKKNWGFVPEHLCYRYKLAPGASIPDHNPLNPKYRLFIAGWKRLPLAFANAIGPSIVRGLG
jgi:FemAB-related protein (PEP-CTERM system-associated)